MVSKTDQFNELHRKNMEIAMRLAQLSMENSQKMAALQANLARELFADGMANAKAQAAAGDPHHALNLRTQFAQQTAQRMMDAAQEIATLGNEARSEFSHLLTEQLATGSKEMTDAFQSFLSQLPGNPQAMMDAVQQATSKANAAFEQMTQMAAAAMGNMNPMAAAPKEKPAKKK